MRAREIALQGFGFGVYSLANQGIRLFARWPWMGRSRKTIIVPQDALRIEVRK